MLRRLHLRRELIVVRLKGDLDASSVPRTNRILRAALGRGPKVLEVDLSLVTRLTAEGTPPLFLAAHGARGQGTSIAVTHADEQARAVMQRLGLERYLSDQDPGR
ncbi:STAS domain-containing protein [Streptomyces sp. NPDC048629]|uniref:STAS domain-containing protein n=1 Tax=Streptomyces sp. NPDC048629 TaxID=3154824 RepID=UPI003423C8E4